jgi:FMN-dependent NADH-azoreductase
MKVLVVNSSGRAEASVSRLLVAELLAKLTAAHPSAYVVHRDVAQGLPFVNDLMIGAFFTPGPARTPDQQASLAVSDELVAEIQGADVVVFGAPIYNFGLPAALKAYFDLICRSGLTFAFTASGPEGLLVGKKAYVVVASGGTEVGSAYDFATPHLRAILGFIGITDVTFFQADQLQVRGEAPIAQARTAIRHYQPALA